MAWGQDSSGSSRMSTPPWSCAPCLEWCPAPCTRYPLTSSLCITTRSRCVVEPQCWVTSGATWRRGDLGKCRAELEVGVLETAALKCPARCYDGLAEAWPRSQPTPSSLLWSPMHLGAVGQALLLLFVRLEKGGLVMLRSQPTVTQRKEGGSLGSWHVPFTCSHFCMPQRGPWPSAATEVRCHFWELPVEQYFPWKWGFSKSGPVCRDESWWQMVNSLAASREARPISISIWEFKPEGKTPRGPKKALGSGFLL